MNIVELKEKKISILSVLSGDPTFLWGVVEGCIEGCGFSKNHLLDLNDFLGWNGVMKVSLPWPRLSPRVAE